MLEVAELEEELAVRIVALVAVDVDRLAVLAGDDRLPGGRAAVLAAGGVVEPGAGFVVVPHRARRLRQHGRVQAQLLVGG
ncbi:hypothetical protein CATMIT_01838, partial [Catenibacterium mitsuokai DSM 15897]